DLRRTFATDCDFKGTNPKRLQRWLGHSSIETTMKYYVVAPEDEDLEEIKRLDVRKDTYRDTLENEELKESAELLEKNGEPCRIRTCDPLIKSQLLYQLS